MFGPKDMICFVVVAVVVVRSTEVFIPASLTRAPTFEVHLDGGCI